MKKHILSLAAALLAIALSFVGCFVPGDEESPGIALYPTTMSLTVGGTAVLTATVVPPNATNQELTWTVSPPAGVVLLVGGGAIRTVTGLAAGNATVTVKTQDGTKAATCAVTVTGGQGGVSVAVSPKTATLAPGGAQAFTATVTGSANTAVAWIASGGAITQGGAYTAPAAEGIYTVRATSQADATKSDTATVTVTTGGPGSGWAAVSAGEDHSLALKTDGSLWAWGEGINGQLGLGYGSGSSKPYRVGWDSWKAVSAGGDNTFAIKADGGLWAWGYNYYGQLGLGDKSERNVPTRVGAANDWKIVSAGSYHTLAIKADGSLWAWGRNSDGELGLGDDNDRNVPTRVGTDSNWAAVSAGLSYSWSHTLALKTDGSLWAWGDNSCGQLGLGTSDYDDHPTPTRVGADNNWKAVSAGGARSLAIKADGSLWAWGRNDGGSLGLGDANSNRNTPTRVGSDSNWAAVSAGGSDSLAVKNDGSLWAWGGNYYGELGLGDTTNNRDVPTRVGADSNWAAVSVVGWHTLAIKTDGSLWAWGRNGDGQLGIGTRDDDPHPTPTCVP